MTSPAQATAAAAQTGKAATAAAAAQPSRFGGLMKGLLLGGLLSAGLAGIFGVGALSSILGFLLQGLLIGGLIYLALAFFRNRGAKPAMATAAAGAGNANNANAMYRQANAMPGSGGPGSGGGTTVTVTPDDFNRFEALLGEVQGAYGRNDLKTLGDRVTPEMLSYFAQELDGNAKKGVRNELGAPKLVQGDLSESWRDKSGEYATVAMRYAITDVTLEAGSGHVVSGSKTTPQEVTEVWTFRRDVGGTTKDWELSAIQQA